jgi:GT2 family glycosyltransferase
MNSYLADLVMNEPLVGKRTSVIILTINQRQQTLRCLEHLQRSKSSDDSFKITVWDNGSTDGTTDAIRKFDPSITVLRSNTNLGVAGGRNAAAKAVMEQESPDILLFLDNDMVVEENFVKALTEPFSGENSAAIGQTQAKLLLSDDPERINDGGGCNIQFWLGRTRPVGYGEPDRGQFDANARCTACCGGAMAVRADLFVSLAGFDERFNPFGPEDLDFSLRLQKMGFEAWYVPSATAFHDVNHTIGGTYSEEYAASRSRHWLRLMRRHANAMDWLGFIFIGVPTIAVRVLIREGSKGNLGVLRGLLAGVLGRK